MNAWVAVLGAAAGTYMLRACVLVCAAGRPLPRWFNRALPSVAPAATGALLAGSIMAQRAERPSIAMACVAAVVVTRWTRSPYAALAMGFPTLWVLLAVT